MNKTDKKRLLIVDDEPNVTMTLSEILEVLGPQYQIDIANSGSDALELVEKSNYDVILTDYKMPGMNGLELAREIHKITPKTQIILMTAYDSESLRNAAESVSLNGFIKKPFTNQKIREYITGISDAETELLAFIIEDNQDISYLFSRALSQEGFRVEIFHDGTTAQERLKTASPYLIVLDMHLPGVDGATLLTQIRDTKHLEDTIVFVATADNLAGEFNRASVDLVLQKPITFSQLRQLAKRYKDKTVIQNKTRFKNTESK